MPYSAKILADSVGPNGVRLTTWELTYPRFVHAELMTHRLFSRNSASSRAIPTKKLMTQIRKDPALPVFWGKNQSGMQAREELGYITFQIVRFLWLQLRWGALLGAWMLTKLGLHKQIANRILEPWMFITVIVTATEWDNFFKLRCHPDAQPEIGHIAKWMKAEYFRSVPRELKAGQWHLPMTQEDEDFKSWGADPKKVATARIARVSYLTHDGKRDLFKDTELHDGLVKSGHWSPFEHVARAQGKKNLRWSGNFRGWTQYRETLDTNFTVVGRS